MSFTHHRSHNSPQPLLIFPIRSAYFFATVPAYGGFALPLHQPMALAEAISHENRCFPSVIISLIEAYSLT